MVLMELSDFVRWRAQAGAPDRHFGGPVYGDNLYQVSEPDGCAGVPVPHKVEQGS